jgi:1-acyl-sn-glycerol-3-phosphate acyltransferase
MLTRLILLLIDGLLLLLLAGIFSIGHDFDKSPMRPGCQRSLVKGAFHVTTKIFLFLSGVSLKHTYLDVDYSEYLGSNYKNEKKKAGHTSTIVANHVSWLDILVLA